MAGAEESRDHAPDGALDWFDGAACGLLRTDDDGLIFAANRTFCGWVGHSPDVLVGKRRFQELLSAGGRIFHQTHWMPLLRMQGSISEVKLEVVHADGSKLPMVMNALRRNRDGTLIHEVAAFVARDRDKYERELVISRKRLEELVIQATGLEAEAKDRALLAEQMIGIVSHDLRNPLSAIAMGAALLSRDASENQKRVVERIRRSTDRATGLIADLLDFTQARVGKSLPIELEPIDLHLVIHEAVDEIAHVHPSRNVAHVRTGDGSCSADPNRMTQMVGNLVSNALAYGNPEMPVTVTSAIEADAFVVSVHNHGEPIPAETRAVIFDAMKRGTTAARREGSVGLGLFIVREIVKAHGGRIDVSSTTEAGTTFRAVFPRGVSAA